MPRRPVVRYRDLLSEIAGGARWSAYIDDTGPGGRSSTPETLPADRETHVAVVLSPSNGATLMKEMPGALLELKSMAGATEFHFAHVYSGKGRYRDLPITARLGIFEFMASIFNEHEFDVLVQSIDAASSAHVIERFRGLGTPPGFPFRFHKHRDLSLFLSILRIKWFLEQRLLSDDRAILFVDEGWKKNGTAMQVPPWSSFLENGCVFFGRSQDIFGLQLADFAAYTLNRTQQLRGMESLSELDEAFLRIAEPLAGRFVNIPAVEGEFMQNDDGNVSLKTSEQ